MMWALSSVMEGNSTKIEIEIPRYLPTEEENTEEQEHSTLNQ